jgi:hypothetical protein
VDRDAIRSAWAAIFADTNSYFDAEETLRT